MSHNEESLGLPVLLERSIVIERPARDVWAFIRDMENYPQWFPGIVQMDSADDRPVATVGKTYRETAIVPGGREEAISVRIVAADETARHLAIEASLKPVLPRFDYRVAEDGPSRSTFHWRCSGRARGAYAALGRRIMPLILKPRLEKALSNLKRILDGADSQVMRSAHFLRFGPAEKVLLLSSRAERPVAKRGEVLVRQMASSINQIDCHRRMGYGRNVMRMRGALNFPVRLGNDIAGVVEAVGPGVRGFRPGDPVFGVKAPSSDGTFAEYVAVPAAQIARKPDGLSFGEAAALPYAFMTAYRALVADGGLTRANAGARRIFVQGGGGAVGSMAVQLAKAWGAHVVTTCNRQHVERVRTFGADQVIDYAAGDLAGVAPDFDIVLCAADAGEEVLLLSLLKTGAGARYVSVIHPTLARTDERGAVRGFMAARAELRALNRRLRAKDQRAYWTLFAAPREGIDAMATLAGRGALKPIVDRVFRLQEVASAFAHVESGKAKGKVVIDIAGK